MLLDFLRFILSLLVAIFTKVIDIAKEEIKVKLED